MPTLTQVPDPLDDPVFRERVLEHLAAVPIFQSLPPEQLQAVASIARLSTYAPGEPIFHPGEPATTLHVVLEGTMRLVQPSAPDGQVRLAASREPGQCYGEVGFLTNQPRHLGALNGPEAGQHLIVDRADFERLVARLPALGQTVMTALVSTLVRRMDNMPPYVRDYLVWGHRPRPVAPPGPRSTARGHAFAVAGGAWGFMAALFMLGLELVFAPVARPAASAVLAVLGLTLAGMIAGQMLGRFSDELSNRAAE